MCVINGVLIPPAGLEEIYDFCIFVFMRRGISDRDPEKLCCAKHGKEERYRKQQSGQGNRIVRQQGPAR